MVCGKVIDTQQQGKILVPVSLQERVGLLVPLITPRTSSRKIDGS